MELHWKVYPNGSPFKTLTQKIPHLQKLEVSKCPGGKISKYWLELITDGLGNPVLVPIMVAKGEQEGPVLGLTAAVHGNELNGIPVIQKLFKEIDPKSLKGTIVGVPAVNIPSLVRKKRRFVDGTDLNHIMPGKQDGNVSQVYAWRFVHSIINQLDYLADLHTASFGRINSYYVRADMRDKITGKMAWLQNPDIIVHNPPSDGTLRGAAEEMGIRAITMEVGDPNRFQKGMIRSGLEGIQNLMIFLKMIDGEVQEPETEPVLCERSYWLYSSTGGMLTTYPDVTDQIKKGDLIARQFNIFGDVICEYYAPEDGIVIGKSINPVSQSGARILHLGIIK